MTEKTSDSGLKEQIADFASNVISSRLKGPLYIYLLCSLATFNWKHILLIAMSDEKIETLLKNITSTYHFSHNYFYWPLVVGFGMSIAMPAMDFIVNIFSSFVRLGMKWTDTTMESAWKWLMAYLKSGRKQTIQKTEAINGKYSLAKSELEKAEASFQEHQSASQQVREGIIALAARLAVISGYLGTHLEELNDPDKLKKIINKFFDPEEYHAGGKFAEDLFRLNRLHGSEEFINAFTRATQPLTEDEIAKIMAFLNLPATTAEESEPAAEQG